MSVKKNRLILFWENLEKAGDKFKISRAAKSLQRQAEIDVAKAQEDHETTKAKLETTKVEAKDDAKAGFKKIVEAYMEVQIEKKKFDDAIAIYRELFEEEPRLLD